MTKKVLRHEATGKEYEVVAVDQEHKTVTLRTTKTFVEFIEPLDWERFKAMGYRETSPAKD